ncbi:MAG: ABC transporter permease, partial [Pirellulaceae bacterium]|nr:ABC transporter permease [Pirellulaceae bacterium]
ATVSKGRRAKLGVVRTDALLMGGVSMTMGRQIEKQSLITELEKQYDVEDVDPTNPIDIEKYDALLVAQPSSLSPAAFDNVMKAIEAGEPTAIFEDPRPLSFPWVIGTGDIKRAGGGSLGGGGRLVKPDMKKLWRLLGVAVQGDTGFDGQFRPNLVWQDSLPYPHLPAGFFEKEFVFANNTAPGGEGTLNSESQISSGLVEVLFPAPGQLAKTEDSEFEFVALAQTGAMSGMIKDEDFLRYFPRSPRELENARSGVVPDPIIIAARIRADAGKKQDEQDDDASGGDATSETRGIDVVYVADIDLLSSQFVELRAQRHNDMEWNFQNVTFALNVIDELARDNRFINIRKRRPKHYTLRLVEYQAEQARIVERNLQEQYEMEHRKAVAEQDAKMREEQERFQDEHDELQRKQREGSPDFDPTQLTKLIQEAQIKGEHAQRARDVKIAKLERTRDTQIERVRRQTELHILRIQNKFKFWAIVLPPIPPLLIGVIVWVVRRLREREGIAKTRLRV